MELESFTSAIRKITADYKAGVVINEVISKIITRLGIEIVTNIINKNKLTEEQKEKVSRLASSLSEEDEAILNAGLAAPKTRARDDVVVVDEEPPSTKKLETRETPARDGVVVVDEEPSSTKKLETRETSKENKLRELVARILNTKWEELEKTFIISDVERKYPLLAPKREEVFDKAKKALQAPLSDEDTHVNFSENLKRLKKALSPAERQIIIDLFKIELTEEEQSKLGVPQLRITIEGGGVAGIAEVIPTVTYAPYAKHVAGTSAGAILALLVALGCEKEEIMHVLNTVSFARFQENKMEMPLRVAGFLSGKRSGLNSTEYPRQLLATIVKIKAGDPNLTLKELTELAKINPNLKTLLVVAQEVYEHKGSHGLSPYFFHNQEIPVVDAVIASMSIPVFFNTKDIIINERNRSFIDGGVLEFNFPIKELMEFLGDIDFRKHIGIRADGETENQKIIPPDRKPVTSGRGVLKATYAALLDASHRKFQASPEQIAVTRICFRTITYPDGKKADIPTTKFTLTKHEQESLVLNGAKAELAMLEMREERRRLSALGVDIDKIRLGLESFMKAASERAAVKIVGFVNPEFSTSSLLFFTTWNLSLSQLKQAASGEEITGASTLDTAGSRVDGAASLLSDGVEAVYRVFVKEKEKEEEEEKRLATPTPTPH